ncbi:MAG TPA: hypothetical protein VM597_32510 [Gemmataceae bacterium]|jgi:hypothetical protein|nr:hypothetical protein [Gemmataceae bacterium]
MKPTAFKVNPRKLGYFEMFRCARNPVEGLLGCALKIFLGPSDDGYGMLSFGDELDRRTVDDLPRRVQQATENYRAKVEKLGFVPGFVYSLESYGLQEAHGIVYRHKSGTAAVSIAFARNIHGPVETVTTVVGFNTPLDDDTYVMTSNNKRMLKKPPGWDCEYMPGAAPKDVFERHQERVERSGGTPRKVRSDDDLENLVLNCENEETAFNFQRGVYVKMTRADVKKGTRLKADYDRYGGRPPGEEDEDDYRD